MFQIEADGHGVTCEDALRQAKVVASDKLVGSFVTSKKSVDGDAFEEDISEYSGGVITRYSVMKTTGSAPCSVTIVADVSPDKTNLLVAPGTSRINISVALEASAKRAQTREMLRLLVQRPEMMTPVVDNIVVGSGADGSTQLQMEISTIAVSDKWKSDLESFLKVHAHQYVFEKSDRFHLGKWLVEKFGASSQIPVSTAALLYGQPYPDGTSIGADGEGLICFPVSGSSKTLNCYLTWLAQDVYTLLRGVRIGFGISDQQRVRDTGAYNVFALISRSPGTYYSSEFGDVKGVFVVGEYGFPMKNTVPLARGAPVNNSYVIPSVEFLVH